MTGHTTRKHARLAPSAAERWWECPGSIAASANIPEQRSAYADEGTAAHELAAHLLTTGFDADRHIGDYVNLDVDRRSGKFAARQIGERSFPVTEEMAEGVQQYLDFVRDLKNTKHAEWQSEQFVDLSWIGVPGLDGGTADFACYHSVNLVLYVVDFKYGRGVFVEPQDNKQLLCYALGVARKFSNRGLRKVRLTVVQPRCPAPNGETTRTWEADVLDLFDFETDIRERALATQKPDAPLKPGEWCKFCPAGATCEARFQYMLKLAQAEFDALGNLEVPVVTEMAPEKVAEALKHATLIEDWCRRVKEFAHAEAVAGRVPPGFKLVAKRATRKWVDDGQAQGVLYGFGLDDSEVFVSKLKSPAQIEPLLPGKNKRERAALLEYLVVKESSGTVLAPNEDPRPAVQTDAAQEFDEVQAVQND